ncbi:MULTISPECIES: type II toxin-antitoxin system RelE/ParE family toxin [Phascolarctobacterium]|uniref:type II toxin-antitoxin system RelE/ParE family toxin n=2 Tax=Phascolarctobacterium succinatutens TaxID=626940 RepID=UPI003AF016DC
MYKIYFYRDKRGRQPVYDYLMELASRKDKNSRIKLNKHNDYMQALAEFGLQLGEPYIKHIQDNIWELRPLRDRSLFAVWENNSFVMLHCFMKKTQKTPKSEIAQALREWEDFKLRSEESEK